MVSKTKKIIHKILGHREHFLDKDDVQDARHYIAEYWSKLERSHPKDDETLIGLPHKYLVPAFEEGHPFDFNEMYYWDSYFMVQGLLDEEHKELVTGILENLLSMQRRFKIIPNASRTYLMGRSQPPLLTSFIFDVYNTYKMDKAWLKERIAIAEHEYKTVWMGSSKPNWRQVHKGLSRYFDINMLHDLAEAESGWDMTPRFNRRALNFLPVDLNAMLYKYEVDFAKAAQILGKNKTAKDWQHKADERKKTMNKLMWSDLRDMYFDYNFVKEKRGNIASLATFFPMWAGMVSNDKAREMVKSLKNFEQKGGLSTTDSGQLNQVITTPGAMPTQWAHPNGWAPLHFIVVHGLQRYGYFDDANRIARKWIRTNLDWFNKHGVFLEKYNVANPHKPPMKGVYPSQTGFGWTNAVFERFCQEFIDD
jgi:alpha,alpha-trehalase